MIEPAVGNGKISNWWNDMPGHFGLLTCQAFSRPFCDVGAHVGPDDLLSDGLSRTLDSRVT